MAKSEKLPSWREAVVLAIIVNGERYGREIRNEYEKLTEKKMPLGSLYTTLMRMEHYGFVDSWLGESCHKRGGNRRKYFKITGLGERALNAYEILHNRAIFGAILGCSLTGFQNI